MATEILRLTFSRDSLGSASGPEPRAPRPAGRFLRLLFEIEPLPMDPPAPPRRTAPSAPGLFARETLPLDPVPEAPPRPRRLAALFAPEKLDDPQ